MKQESWLEVRSGRAKGRRWSIPEGRSSIGRSISNDLRLRDAGVSRYHVELRHVGGRPEVRDRGSKNGAYLDGRRLDVEWHALVHGQELEVGEVRLRVCLPDGLVEAALAGEGTRTRTLEHARMSRSPAPSVWIPLGFACLFAALSWMLWR